MVDPFQLLSECTGFQWDEGNADKNWERHQVTCGECEEVFFNEPLVAVPDSAHSQRESRCFALGRTSADRHLFLVFTIRERAIRVISARDMSRKERKIYEQAEDH